MKNIYKKIVQEFKKIPTMDRETALGILMEVNSKIVAEKLLAYLNSLDLYNTNYSLIVDYIDELNVRYEKNKHISYQINSKVVDI